MSELAVPRPGLGVWLMAARPRTLSAAVSPVLVGTAIAHRTGALRPVPALLAYCPTAVQEVAEAHETAYNALNVAPVGVGVDWMAQVAPFQASAKVTLVPALFR